MENLLELIEVNKIYSKIRNDKSIPPTMWIENYPTEDIFEVRIAIPGGSDETIPKLISDERLYGYREVPYKGEFPDIKVMVAGPLKGSYVKIISLSHITDILSKDEDQLIEICTGLII